VIISALMTRVLWLGLIWTC